MDNNDLEKNINVENGSDESIASEEIKEEVVEESNDSISDETFTYTIDNNNVNNDYSKKNYDDNKSFIYIFIGLFILIFIIVLLIFLVNKNSSKTSGYNDIESRMVSGAKKYYEKNSESLPIIDGGSVTISTDTLIENSFLKPFSEMVKEGVSCSGYVSVYNNDNNYAYFPYLNCSDEYESLKLSQKIIDSGVVTTGDGLYQLGDRYVFRGEYPNNYVKFNDKLWRIIGINSDGSIKMIYSEDKVERNVWDDRYNSSRDSYVGINDFRVSRLLEYLKKIYEDNTYVSKNNKVLLVKHDWCIGKISGDEALISNLNLCSDIYNDLYVGVVQVDDVLIPSIDSNCNSIDDDECTNYNYFYDINSGWTMNVSSDKTYIAFSSNSGSVSSKNASIDNYVRPVININGNILYSSGLGTVDDPYVISY